MNRAPNWDLGDGDPEHLLRAQGFVRLGAERSLGLAQADAAALKRLSRSWADLPEDRYLRDGGRYRRRRHASVLLDPVRHRIEGSVRRPHWQPVDYNALHGGIERWFEPIPAAVLDDPLLHAWVSAFGRLFAAVAGRPQRYCEIHQFRIDTRDGIGRPTPEGAHRDGVDFVAVVLIDRQRVRGGETRVFEAEGPAGIRFTLEHPGSALLLDDHRVIHETTPLQPIADAGHRDTLVLTYRHQGFLDPVG